MTHLFHATVPALDQGLANLDGWFDVALAHAATKKFDVSVLLGSRLAPDQYHLTRQVQAACDAAKFAAARVAGREPPKHPDTEVTLDEVRARIRTVRDYLATFTADDFRDRENTVVPLSFAPGKGLLATDYVRQMALPNFYFHTGMAYAILRHNGVPLGKSNALGAMTLRDI